MGKLSRLRIDLANSGSSVESISRATNVEHDDFVNSTAPNERCPMDSFLKKILDRTKNGIVNNDLRAFPIVTYLVDGKYIAWFDTSEDIGYIGNGR